MSAEEETDVQQALSGEIVQRPSVLLEWSGGQAVLDANGQGLVIGSSPEADVTIADTLISRIHAELRHDGRGPWLRDLGSRNGTFLDGILVESARVRDGTQLTLGGTVIRVRFDAELSEVPLWPLAGFGSLEGGSTKMRELFRRLDLAAKSDATVLIQGETGTGKELAADAIHCASRRGGHPFAILDCGSLAESILESELFGHARGAFTGAVSARAGVVEAAEGGTVFLDEVGELPLSLQPKLLRLMESRTLRRLGENETRAVDVRFIAATHRDLQAMINEGSFREDLYFRLSVLRVRMPALRERAEDIPILVESLAGGKPLAPALLRTLGERPWPGNVRELRNFVERAQAFGHEEALRELASGEAERPPVSGGTYHELRRRCLDAFEREYVQRLLSEHAGDTRLAAEAGGLDRSHLYRLMRRHDIK